MKDTRRCYTRGETKHLASKCPQTKLESSGRPAAPAQAEQVSSRGRPRPKRARAHPSAESLLLSSSEEEPDPQIKVIRIAHHCSHTQCVKVFIQGEPAYGLIDSGADITIIGGSLFKKVAAVAQLGKNFMKADKVPGPTISSPFSWMVAWTLMWFSVTSR